MKVEPMTQAYAAEIAEWRYEFPYEWYDTASDPRRVELFANPDRRDGLRAVVGDDGSLVGFFNFVHEGDEVRVGLGMRPDLTGRGLAQPFIEAGLEYARAVGAAPLSALGRELERACAPRVSPRRVPRGEARRALALRRDGAARVMRISDEVREATAVVALETTLVAHGFPPGEGVEVGLESERQVRASGAVPAAIGVLDGEIVVGLNEDELARFDASARKVGPRDLAVAVEQRAIGATTVGGTLAVAKAAGISVMATGGLGGVHRGFPDPPDVSADLGQLAKTQALVVSAGVKSLLDVPATTEVLETLGVPVLGYRTDTLPLFYAAEGGPPVSARIESADEAARIAAAHWQLGGGGILVGRPPDFPLDDVEPLIEQALAEAHARSISGQAVTPFILSYLHRESGGRTQKANKDLVAQNARLAGEIATGLSARS